MNCKCGGRLWCVDTRQQQGYRRRRYKCDACEKRTTTIEVEVDKPPRGRGKKMDTEMVRRFSEFDKSELRKKLLGLLDQIKAELDSI